MFNHKTRLVHAAIAAFAFMSTGSAPAQVTTATTVPGSSTTSSTTPAAEQLSDTFSASEGSRAAAATLIDGMRTGKDVRMADVTVSGTGKTMGYGNVNIALSLARADAGTSATTKAYLSSLDKVMDMRAGGMGWGLIAKDLGFKLGEVVSTSKAPDSSMKAGQATRSDKSNNMPNAGTANGHGHGVAATAGGPGAGSNGHGGHGNGNASNIVVIDCV